MKKLFFILMICATNTVFSQTTIEDFNYIKKGFANALQNGYETRKDLIPTAAYLDTIGNDACSIMQFKKNNEIKGYLILKNNRYLICVPNQNSDKFVSETFEYELFRLDNDNRYITMKLMRKFMLF